MPNPNAFRETNDPQKAARASEKQATRNPKQNSPGRMKSDAFPHPADKVGPAPWPKAKVGK